jgi:hypothetical protein
MEVPVKDTLPTPWSMIMTVALDAFQSSTAGLPAATAAGEELNELITGSTGTAVQKHEVNNIGTAKIANSAM